MTDNATDNIVTTSNIPTVSHDYIQAADSISGGTTPRTFGRQILSGNVRGNQNITGTLTITDPDTNKQNIIIDGTGDAITVTNTDGSSVGLGKIPDNSGDFGFFSLDKNGKLIMKIVNGTKYVYDPEHSYVNVTQDGLLPDGTGGFVAAKPGIDVKSAF